MKNRNKGFSLLEVLVVIGIITVLVGLVMPAINIARRNSTGTETVSEMSQLDTALIAYFTDNGSFPRQNQMLASLSNTYFTFDSKRVEGNTYNDKWDSPYLYLCPGVISAKGYDLFSMGLLKAKGDSAGFEKIMKAIYASVTSSSGGDVTVSPPGLGGETIWGLPKPEYNDLVKAILALLRSTNTGFNLAVMINVAHIPIEFADLSCTGAVASYDPSAHEIYIDVTYAAYGPIEVVTSFLAHEATHVADNLANGDTDFDSIEEEYDAFYNGAMVWEELTENKTFENLSEFSGEAVTEEEYWLGVMKSGEETAKEILRQYYPYLPEEDQYGDSYVVAKRY